MDETVNAESENDQPLREHMQWLLTELAGECEEYLRRYRHLQALPADASDDTREDAEVDLVVWASQLVSTATQLEEADEAYTESLPDQPDGAVDEAA